jgi:hypothetical protein
VTDQNVHPEIGQPGPFSRLEPWEWRAPEHGEHYRRCSFCGSVCPDDLAAEAEWRAEWADRKYGYPHKFYVDIPNRNADRLYVLGSHSGNNPPTGHPGWIARTDLIPEQADAVARDGYDLDDSRRSHFLFGHRQVHHAKFYSVHLRATDLDPAVKHAIEQRSGLVFEFEQDCVAWRPAS